MKKVFKSAVMLMAAFMLPLGFTSCSSDDDPVENNDFTNKAYGQDAMDACDELCNALRAAYSKVNNANLSADQETYLKNVCANAVDNTIQPTYKSLADAVEKLHTALPTECRYQQPDSGEHQQCLRSLQGSTCIVGEKRGFPRWCSYQTLILTHTSTHGH